MFVRFVYDFTVGHVLGHVLIVLLSSSDEDIHACLQPDVVAPASLPSHISPPALGNVYTL